MSETSAWDRSHIHIGGRIKRLEQYGIQSAAIELEITESAVMEKVEKVTETLVGLHELGFKLAIDDFGTGYSSMTYLKKFPVDTLKIDASFVDGVHLGGDDAAITRAIVALGKSLGLRVVAEGVENREQLLFLQAHGCEHAQGFFLCTPISGKDFAHWWWDNENNLSKVTPLSV